jgi:hypothetical protein
MIGDIATSLDMYEFDATALKLFLRQQHIISLAMQPEGIDVRMLHK